jgi:hypothetical protein
VVGLTAPFTLCGAPAEEALETTGLLKRSDGRTAGWIGEGASAALLVAMWPAWWCALLLTAALGLSGLFTCFCTSPNRTIVSASFCFAQSASSLLRRSSCNRSITNGCWVSSLSGVVREPRKYEVGREAWLLCTDSGKPSLLQRLGLGPAMPVFG